MATQNKTIGIVVAVIAVLIIALVAGLYLSGIWHTNANPNSNPSPSVSTPTPIPTPTPTPFDYHLDVSPTSGTVQQGNRIQTTVTITYVQGSSSENVALSASGGPDGTTYSFDNTSYNIGAIGYLFASSTLTINVPASAPTNPYSVTVTSIADNGKQYSMGYTVSVLSAKIQVSGSINTVGLGTHPTQVQFVDQQTGLTYTGYLSGNSYSISLQNQHTYNIVGYYGGLLGISGTFNGGSIYEIGRAHV